MFYWLVLIGGVGFIIFNLFLSSGGQAKFKSDLPKSDIKIKGRKVVIAVCFSILLLLSLGLLIALIISLL